MDYKILICIKICDYIKIIGKVPCGLSKTTTLNFFISWPILSSSLPYKSSNKRCNLCLKEKFLIICRPELSSLNKRNELVFSCRHRTKALLRYKLNKHSIMLNIQKNVNFKLYSINVTVVNILFFNKSPEE